MIRRARDVVHRTVEADTFLLHLGSGRYFSLNRTGAAFWEALGETGATFEAVEEALVQRFDVPPTVLRRDLAQLIERLTELELVSIENTPAK